MLSLVEVRLGERSQNGIKKMMLRIHPGHFDTSPPQWGLLSDRGDYKKFFFGLGLLKFVYGLLDSILFDIHETPHRRGEI